MSACCRPFWGCSPWGIAWSWSPTPIGSRDPADKAIAIERARQHGAEIVTSEMVLFEWLRDSRHPRFREVQQLLK